MWARVIAFLLITGAVLLAAGCEDNQASMALTEAEKAKLGPTLQQVVAGDTTAVRESARAMRSDGTAVYLVFIRTSEADVLRRAGLPIGSVSGEMATARLSADQLRQAARLDAVKAIRISGQAAPTQ